MRQLRVLFATALLLGLGQVSQASVLYSQMATPWNTSSQRSDLRGGDYRMADDFQLGAAATIESVGIAGAVGGVMTNHTGFKVAFYDNGTNGPGTQIGSTQTITSGWSQSGQLFEIPLANSVAVNANTKYWVVVQGLVDGGMTGDGSFKVFWANGDHDATYAPAGSSAITFDGGAITNAWSRNWTWDIYQWRADVYNNASGSQSLDMAFSLSGTPGASTPEPSSIALVAIGLIGLVACAWKKRK